MQGREIQTNMPPSPCELDKNVGRRILHKVFYKKEIFEYRLHYVTTDVNYLHQYLDEVKTVGKAFIQLGLRPGSSIILMMMIILMITTIMFIFIITITISNQVMALASSASTPLSGSSQVRDVRPKTYQGS